MWYDAGQDGHHEGIFRAGHLRRSPGAWQSFRIHRGRELFFHVATRAYQSLGTLERQRRAPCCLAVPWCLARLEGWEDGCWDRREKAFRSFAEEQAADEGKTWLVGCRSGDAVQ